MSSNFKPIFCRLGSKRQYDISTERTELSVLPCLATRDTLNAAVTPLEFTFKGDFAYRLASNNTGFHFRVRFRTKNNNNNAHDVKITLSSNFFGHMFQRAELQLAGCKVEEFEAPGVIMDTFYHLEGSEFRDHNGESLGFIPDTTQTYDNTIGRRSGDVAGADAAAIVGAAAGSINHADIRIVNYNNKFNNVVARRNTLYNYTVTNDVWRTMEMFVPLNRIFGYCAEVDDLLKYIDFKIIMTRGARDVNCYFGAAGTTYEFELQDISLILEQIRLNAELAAEMEEEYRKPFTVHYLKRICNVDSNMRENTSFSHNKTSNKGIDGIPRYVFCIFKNGVLNEHNAESNYQLCPHANIQSITVSFAGNTYTARTQDADFDNNKFIFFYKELLNISKEIMANQDGTGLSMFEYKNLYTIYAIDLSAQPISSTTAEISIDVTRRSVPDASTTTNLRTLIGYFLYVNDAVLSINCIEKTAKLL